MDRTAASEGTICIVDDEDDVRESLTRLLRSAGLAVQGFASAVDFLDAGAGAGADCLLLDVNMPGLTGPELHEILQARNPGLPIVYLTGRSNVAIGVRAMKQGALDFLEKPVDADALLGTLGRAIEAGRANAARRRARGDVQARIGRLSAREREVMEHVVRGRLNKQIAGDLGIAEKTVKVHRSRVMAKMQVRSVAELVHLWEQVAGGGA